LLLAQDFQSRAAAVGQAAAASVGRSDPGPLRASSFIAPRCERTPLFESDCFGVGQLVKVAAPFNVWQTFAPLGRVFASGLAGILPPLPSDAEAVGQLASATVLRLESLLPASLYPFCAGVPAIGVGHEPQSLSDVRCADARSWQIRRRNGVICVFQVSANMIEPSEAIRSSNLLAK